MTYIELLAVANWILMRDWQPLGFSRIEEALNAGGGAMDFAVDVPDILAATAPEGLTVRLPGCRLVLRQGPAKRITEVSLSRAGTPVGEVAGLKFTNLEAEA